MKKILFVILVVACLLALVPARAGQVISGTVNGTGTNLYVGIGFVPDYVRLVNVESAVGVAQIEWAANMRDAGCIEGVLTETNGTRSLLASGGGVRPYRGGEALSSATHVYAKELASRDQRASAGGTTAAITKWELDTASNRTGHFDSTASTTYVGEGSRVLIDGKWYTIEAYSNSTADDSVTLNEAAPSGVCGFIGPMYDFVSCVAGDVTRAGFMIAGTNNVNISGQTIMFEAGLLDR